MKLVTSQRVHVFGGGVQCTCVCERVFQPGGGCVRVGMSV